MIEILMPALSPTMKDGTLSKWLKKEGDKINPGDIIAEIETDKATMEVEAVDSGTLGKILVEDGSEGVKINTPIAILLQNDEDSAKLKDYKSGESDKADDKEKLDKKIDKKNNKEEEPEDNTKDEEDLAKKPDKPEQQPSNNEESRIFASPLARRMALENGVNLQSLMGSGPHGRIIKQDVISANNKGSSGDIIRNNVEYRAIKNGNIRKVIAKRLLESKQKIPHFYLSIDCNLDKLLELRKDINEFMGKLSLHDKYKKVASPDSKISVNDLIIKAAALSLRDCPEINSSWNEDEIHIYNNVDISIAVSIDDGLITPIIKNADYKNIVQISTEMKELAKKAKENKLKPEEFQGGGFSISNLGMFGIKSFNAIVNPPQSAILAIGATEKRVIVDNVERMVVANIMNITLSADHRVVDGVLGAKFLQTLKVYLEKPALLLA